MTFSQFFKLLSAISHLLPVIDIYVFIMFEGYHGLDQWFVRFSKKSWSQGLIPRLNTTIIVLSPGLGLEFTLARFRKALVEIWNEGCGSVFLKIMEAYIHIYVKLWKSSKSCNFGTQKWKKKYPFGVFRRRKRPQNTYEFYVEVHIVIQKYRIFSIY